VIREVMAGAAEPAVTLSVPLGVEIGTGAELGRRALSARPAAGATTSPRWPGRAHQLPRLPAAARGAPALPVHRRPLLRRRTLGRFAYAVLIVEFAAQIATLGLKRGLAQHARHRQAACLRRLGRDAGRLLASAIATLILCSSRRRCSRTAPSTALEWLLPLIVFAIAGPTSRSPRLPIATMSGDGHRPAIVEPWTISIAALALFLARARRLIFSYVLSMLAALARLALAASQSYGIPQGWRPDPVTLWRSPGATRRSPPPTRSNGDRAGSTSRSWACSSRRQWSASIMSRSRSPRCRRS
jgi:hypothetical protein